MSENKGDLAVNVTTKIPNISNNSGNTLLYIVVTEDPSSKTKFRIFGTSKIAKDTSHCIEFKGYEVTKNTNVENFRTFEDVVESAKQENLSLVEMMIPWQKVISIKNVSYKSKV